MSPAKTALIAAREVLERQDLIDRGLATGGSTFTYTVTHDAWCPTPIGDCICNPDVLATAS